MYELIANVHYTDNNGKTLKKNRNKVRT